MITLLTNENCIQFNLRHYYREKRFIQVLEYHKFNKTGKMLRVTSSNIVGNLIIDPAKVITFEYEQRRYNPKVGNEIDKMIKNLQ